MKNIFLLVLHELKDTLWLVEFLSKDISLADTESTRLYKPVLSESIESFYNVKLTIGTPLLWYTDQVSVTTVCQVLKIALNPHPPPPSPLPPPPTTTTTSQPPTIGWCHSAWGTMESSSVHCAMETSFVHFQIVKWAVRQAFTSTVIY